MPFFLWNTKIALIIFVLPAVHKTHTSWGDMDAVVWLRYEDICNQSDFGEVKFLDGWSRPSEDPEGVFVAVGFLGCFARVQKAASLRWWWNAASWASPGNASDSQCSQRAHNKYNLKSLIFYGQHLKGEEKGRTVEEWRVRKCPFVMDLNKTISKKHWRFENFLCFRSSPSWETLLSRVQARRPKVQHKFSLSDCCWNKWALFLGIIITACMA